MPTIIIIIIYMYVKSNNNFIHICFEMMMILASLNPFFFLAPNTLLFSQFIASNISQ